MNGEKTTLIAYVIRLDFISLKFKLVSQGPAKYDLCQPLSLLAILPSWVALFAFLSALWLNWHRFAFHDSGVIFCWQCLVMVTDQCPWGVGRSHWLGRCINADLLNDMQAWLCAKWQVNRCQRERLLSTDKRQHLYSLAMSLSPIWGETFVQDILFLLSLTIFKAESCCRSRCVAAEYIIVRWTLEKLSLSNCSIKLFYWI